MEIVVFLAMMIVPFISIAALIVALLVKKRTDSLKTLVVKFVRDNPRVSVESRKSALDEYMIDDL